MSKPQLKIRAKYKGSVRRQDYSKKPIIAGVKIVDLSVFTDDGGSFCEISRILEAAGIKGDFPDFRLRQLNWSQVEPGTIKAGHLHKKQIDIWFVPPTDRLLVGLIDARRGSRTFEVKMRLILGAGKAGLLYIPAGVVHGYANPYSRPMSLIYLTDQYWTGDPARTDEWRVDYRIFGTGFWEIAKG